MDEADAILSLGVVVGAELGYEGIPVLEVAVDVLDAWSEGTVLHVGADGIIQTLNNKGGGP